MRPLRDSTMLKLASVIAERSTCARRKVGCALTDSHGRVLAIGHNGVPKNFPHCTERLCPGAKLPSGSGLDTCQAIHAEINALMFCPDIMKVHSLYVTASPCLGCIKAILNSSCERIVFLEKYPHPQAEELWQQGRQGLGEWKQGSIE